MLIKITILIFNIFLRTASVGRINKILKCLPTVSRLMLVSQVSFQSELKYKPVKQYDGKFKATNQDDASTKFTVLRNQFKLNEKNPDFVYVELPYVTEGMNLCIVLPSEESSLRELVSNFKYEQSMQLTTLSVFSQVEVHLPVLKVCQTDLVCYKQIIFYIYRFSQTLIWQWFYSCAAFHKFSKKKVPIFLKWSTTQKDCSSNQLSPTLS